MTPPLMTLAVLSYNAGPKLLRCLDSCRRYLPDVPILVWDNASQDESARLVQTRHPEAHLIAAPKNLWFSRGYNRLVAEAGSPLVFLLNADVCLNDNLPLEMAGWVLAHPRVIAASPSICDGGSRRHSAHVATTPLLSIAGDAFVGKPLKRTAWFRRQWMAHIPPYSIFFSPTITNCACLVRREPFLAIGGFCEEQLLYWTEEDFARKSAAASWQQAVYGLCTVTHDHGTSTSTLDGRLLRAIVVHDRLSYMRRYFGLSRALAVEIAIMLTPRLSRPLFDLQAYLSHRSTIRAILNDLKTHPPI